MKTILLAGLVAVAALYFGWVKVDVNPSATVDTAAIKRDLKRADDKARAVEAALTEEARKAVR